LHKKPACLRRRNSLRDSFQKESLGDQGVCKPFLHCLCALLVLLGSLPSPVSASGSDGPRDQAAITEGFQDLEAWEPLAFEKIERHSEYSAVRFDGRQVLKAVSDSSASGIVHSRTFDVFSSPQLTWTWRVDSIYAKGNAERKSGDDYPLRLYVLFEYDPDQAGLGQRITYGLLKTVYGEYPPHSSLNYIWANRQHEQAVLINQYTDKAMMIPVQAGPDRVGEWLTETRNIVEDYRMAFGEEPPAKARLAVMNDSDDTGEASTAYLDWVRVSAENEPGGEPGQNEEAKL